MSDFDVDTPSLDRGHEAIRLAVVAAIANLQQNVADTTDGFTLTDVIFDLLNTVMATLDAHAARIAALEAPTP